MTFLQELNSLQSPSALQISPVPEIGSKAPSSSKLPIPDKKGKPVIVSFLRHCGCPFAENTFLQLRALANQSPKITIIAVSHSSSAATQNWLDAVGGAGKVIIIIDPERELYAQWGLGTSSFYHVLNPSSMLALWRLGREEGVWNRPTESGSRWQMAGNFTVDGNGKVRWVHVAETADDVPDFKTALEATGVTC